MLSSSRGLINSHMISMHDLDLATQKENVLLSSLPYELKNVELLVQQQVFARFRIWTTPPLLITQNYHSSRNNYKQAYPSRSLVNSIIMPL